MANSSELRLARALAPAPKVLLLDEPLSALDLKLRQAMRMELKQIQEDTGITFVFRHPRPGRGADHVRPHRCDVGNGEVQQVGTRP